MSKDSEDYYVRTFKKGDEVPLVHLFNKNYEDLVGFVPRTPTYWIWCCLNRPDVTEESVAIVNKAKKIVGYAVVGKSGDIWELCYDPIYDGKIIVSKLLNWSVGYLEKAGSDSVVLNAPNRDKVVREVCRDLGFTETPPEFLYVSVLDFPSYVYEILQSRKKNLKIKGSFMFRLAGCPPGCASNFSIEIKKKEISVNVESVDNPEITVDADMSNLISCILGTKGVLRAIVTSKVHVHPVWKIPKFLTLISTLQIKSQWFVPRADYG
jgi:hypothetical protein